MPDIEKLEEEAESKGLHGEEEKRYVGGVFNKIRQAHKKASPEKKKAAKERVKKMVEQHAGKKVSRETAFTQSLSMDAETRKKQYQERFNKQPYKLTIYKQGGSIQTFGYDTKKEALAHMRSEGSDVYKAQINGETYHRKGRFSWSRQ